MHWDILLGAQNVSGIFFLSSEFALTDAVVRPTGRREVMMRAVMNFANVVRNVAVMVNVATLAVIRFVVNHLAIGHLASGTDTHRLSGTCPTEPVQPECYGPACYFSGRSSSSDRMGGMQLAMVTVPSREEQLRQWRYLRSLSKQKS